MKGLTSAATTSGAFLLVLVVTASSAAAVTEARSSQLSIQVSCNNNIVSKDEVLKTKSDGEDELKIQRRRHSSGDDTNCARSPWWRPKHANAASIMKQTSASPSSSLDTTASTLEEPSYFKGIMFASTAKRTGFQPDAASIPTQTTTTTTTTTIENQCDMTKEPSKGIEGVADNSKNNKNNNNCKKRKNQAKTKTTRAPSTLDHKEVKRERITNNIQHEQQAATNVVVEDDDNHYLKHEQNATDYHYNSTTLASVKKQNRSISRLESERRWGKDKDDSSSSRRYRHRRVTTGDWKTHPALTRTDIVLASIIRKINTLLLWTVT